MCAVVTLDCRLMGTGRPHLFLMQICLTIRSAGQKEQRGKGQKNHGILSLGTLHGGWASRQGRGDFVIVWIKGEALGAGGCLEAYLRRSSLATLVYLCPTDLTQSDNHFLRLVDRSFQLQF